MTSHTQTDGDLANAIRAGSDQAADELFDRHWVRAWRAAYAVLGDAHSADDAAQRAVERAFRSLNQFKTDGSFGAWLSRIATNQAINMLRARRPTEQLSDAMPGPEVYSEIIERDALLGAVARLDSDRRIVVALRYFCDLDPPEIAQALDIPVGTVSSRLSRALTDLRQHLGVEER